jgi:crotonobetainyl-CoA:carnitine CoA-transferase CaiB-like acyl-CoA transferase
MSDCLAGIRVLDLAMYIPGPLATSWMADMGAEVVKVEAPAGDPMRTLGAVDEDGTTCFYKLMNRGKTVVSLDLKAQDGKAQLARLVAKADVLVEGFRPGTLDRLGFSKDQLHALNPRLVICRLSGYGGTGPFVDRAGHDLNYMAAAGMLAVTGPASRPLMPYPPLADHAGAMLALNAVLAALVRRGVSGKGAEIDVSLAEAALGWSSGVLTMARRWGDPAREQGMLDGGLAHYRIYATKDQRFVTIAALEFKFWESFCRAVGRPDWVARHQDPMPQNDLIAEMEALFAARTMAEWTALLEPANCTFEPVLNPSEVPAHPLHTARGFVHEAADGIVDVAFPMRLDGNPPPRRRPLVEKSVSELLAGWS